MLPVLLWVELVLMAAVHALISKLHGRVSFVVGDYTRAVCGFVFRYLNCVDVDGRNLLWEVPSVDCNSEAYKRGRIVAIVFLVFPVATLPLLIAVGHRGLSPLHGDHARYVSQGVLLG